MGARAAGELLRLWSRWPRVLGERPGSRRNQSLDRERARRRLISFPSLFSGAADLNREVSRGVSRIVFERWLEVEGEGEAGN